MALDKEHFLRALEEDLINPEMTTHQRALWLIHHDQWDQAHELIQEEGDELSCLIHGYLHDMEGDHWNASYWYRRSGHELPERMPDKWEYVVEQLTVDN